MSGCIIINTQWLTRQPGEVVRETLTQLVVLVNGTERRFWKANGYQLGWHKIAQSGCDWDQVVIR